VLLGFKIISGPAQPSHLCHESRTDVTSHGPARVPATCHDSEFFEKMKFLVITVLTALAFLTIAVASSDDEAKLKAISEIEEKKGKPLEKFSVKELRELLRERGVQCAGCVFGLI
jgi:hypothetical protein